MKNKTKRFYELDLLRGIAIIMMIIFHFLYDLTSFLNFSFNMFEGFWYYFGKITAIIFLLLVGVSFSISYSKYDRGYNYYFKRGMSILFIGFLISIITYIFIKESYIIFGILHLIGVSILILPLFKRLNNIVNLSISIIMIYIGIIINNIYFNFKYNYLLFLGLKNISFSSLDYYPILPYFGIILIGFVIGKLLYKNKKRNFKIKDISNYRIIEMLNYLGRNSLIIYIIHQPIILLILKIIMMI